MDRQALMAANEALHQRREKLTRTRTTEKPSPPQDSQSTPTSLPNSSSKAVGLANEFIAVQKVTGSRDLWDSLDTSVHPDLVQAKLMVLSWYRGGMGQGYSCLLAGNVGCGKSHLAKAIQEAMTPFKAHFVEETALVKAIQATYDDNGDSSESYLVRKCVDAELLIYDDLGAYQTRNLGWIENIYRMIFEQRLAERKPVLITTNLSFTTKCGGDFGLMQEHIGPRNYDRLLRGIMTDSGPYYANLFNVPSYQTSRLEQYMEMV